MDALAFAPWPVGIASTNVVSVENPDPPLLILMEVIVPFVIIGVRLASWPYPETFKVGVELYPYPPLRTSTSLIVPRSIIGLSWAELPFSNVINGCLSKLRTFEHPYPIPPCCKLILEIGPLKFGLIVELKVRLFVVPIPVFPEIVTTIGG